MSMYCYVLLKDVLSVIKKIKLEFSIFEVSGPICREWHHFFKYKSNYFCVSISGVARGKGEASHPPEIPENLQRMGNNPGLSQQ